MRRRFRIDSEKYVKTTEETVGAGTVLYATSPYDVPTDVEVEYDPAGGRISVEYIYPVRDEPLSMYTPNADAVIYIGRNSRRLYPVDRPTDSAGPPAFRAAVHQAIGRLKAAGSAERQAGQDDYEIAAEIAAEYAPRMPATAGAG